MQLDEIVAELNRNLETEYGSVLHYIRFSSQSAISGNAEISGIISRLAEDEMRHAEQLADKVAEMGGESTWRVKPFVREGTLSESLDQIIESEVRAIDGYSALIAKLSDQPKIQSMLLSILEDERVHKVTTEGLKESFSAVLNSG